MFSLFNQLSVIILFKEAFMDAQLTLLKHWRQSPANSSV